MNVVGKYFLNIGKALDELINTFFAGSPHETISSRLGRNWRGSALEETVDKGAEIITGKKDHCETAAEYESTHPAAGLDEILSMKEENCGDIHKESA